MSPAAIKRLLLSGDTGLLVSLAAGVLWLGWMTPGWCIGAVGVAAIALLVWFEYSKGAIFDGPFLDPRRRFTCAVVLLFVVTAIIIRLASSGAARPPDVAGDGRKPDEAAIPSRIEEQSTKRPSTESAPSTAEPTASDEDKAMEDAVRGAKAQPEAIPEKARPMLTDIPPPPPDTPRKNYYDEVLKWADKKPGGRKDLAKALCPQGSPAGPACQLAGLLLGGLGFGMGEGDPIERIGKAIDAVQRKQYQVLADMLLRSPPKISFERAIQTIAKQSNTTEAQVLDGLANSKSPDEVCALINSNTSSERGRLIVFAEEKLFGKSEQNLGQFRQCISRTLAPAR